MAAASLSSLFAHTERGICMESLLVDKGTEGVSCIMRVYKWHCRTNE